MAPTLESLGIDRLSVADRRQLVDAILESIGDEEPAEHRLSPEWVAELLRRAKEAELHPEDSYSWEEVKAYARQQAGL